ncbi:MAG: D-arabinono-1,4-lactone oxidase [Bacteroidota bacterium]
MKTWSEFVTWSPKEVLMPNSDSDIMQMIQQANEEQKKIRLIGSGHSFTPLCETEDFTMSLDNLQGVINQDGNLVTAHGGTKLYRLGDELEKLGLSQENLGDINKQSVAGAISTGTHGTGINFGSISTQVEVISFINGKGEKHTASKSDSDPTLFRALQLSLGTFGVLTEIKLKCEKAFHLELKIRKEKLDEKLEQLEQVLNENRHFEFYQVPPTNWIQAKYSNVVDEASSKTSKVGEFINDVVLENWALGMLCKINKVYPKSSKTISNITAKFISNERKVKESHKVFSTVRNVKFKEMEYNVPLENYKTVVKELQQLIAKNNYNISFPIEHRFVQQDNIMLSPANGRNSAYIACHVYKGMDHTRYFADLEAMFVEHGGRPHWGKMHTRDVEFFSQVYPEFSEFNELRKQHDPNELFVSPYIKKILG